MKTILLTGAAIILLLWVNSWGEEVTYTKHIKPLFDARCSGCHGKGAAPEYEAFNLEKEKWISNRQGMKLDSYSHLIFFTAWPDTGSLMRRLDNGRNTKDGKPGNMYKHLGATEEEKERNLEIFKQWIGNWTLKRWGEISKEELSEIKVRY